jgi:hypothetical protein
VNAPGVSRPSSADPVQSIRLPLADGLGEVRIELLDDGTVRFTDRVADLPPYTLEFSADEWRSVVERIG